MREANEGASCYQGDVGFSSEKSAEVRAGKDEGGDVMQSSCKATIMPIRAYFRERLASCSWTGAHLRARVILPFSVGNLASLANGMESVIPQTDTNLVFYSDFPPHETRATFRRASISLDRPWSSRPICLQPQLRSLSSLSFFPLGMIYIRISCFSYHPVGCLISERGISRCPLGNSVVENVQVLLFGTNRGQKKTRS